MQKWNDKHFISFCYYVMTGSYFLGVDFIANIKSFSHLFFPFITEIWSLHNYTERVVLITHPWPCMSMARFTIYIYYSLLCLLGMHVEIESMCDMVID